MFRSVFLLLITLLALGWQGAAETAAAGAEPQTGAAAAAIDYIKTQQNPDGGFIGFGTESSPGVTLDAVFALTSTGPQPTTVVTDGNSPADYLAAQAADYSTDPGSAAKLAYGVVVMGLDASDFGGVDLLAIVDDGFDAATGEYGIDVFDHVFFLMTRHQTISQIPESAVEYLRTSQVDDGGWEFDEGFGSDSNTTALVLQALLGAVGVEPDDAAVRGGLDYLRSLQDESGAFAFFADTEPDAQSTALVIQALVAAGEDISADGPWAPGGVGPLDALLTFQNPGTGAFQFAGEDSPFATYQSVPGLVLAPFPGLKPILQPGTETVTPTPETPTPEPISPPHGDGGPEVVVPDELPGTGGGGARSGGRPWAAVAVLAAVGAAVVVTAATRRRAA